MSGPWKDRGPGEARNYAQRSFSRRVSTEGTTLASRARRSPPLSTADINGLYALLGQKEFVAFDFETTGLDAARERVVEIGAIRFTLREECGRWQLMPGEEFVSLVNPGRAIPPQASAIHGIHDLDVTFSPSFKNAAPGFLSFIGDAVLVAHNAPFDLGFLAAECERAGIEIPANPAYDTIRLARTAVPQLPSYALGSLASSFGIGQKDAHRGADDARVCMELFTRCIAVLFGNE